MLSMYKANKGVVVVVKVRSKTCAKFTININPLYKMFLKFISSSYKYMGVFFD